MKLRVFAILWVVAAILVASWFAVRSAPRLPKNLHMEDVGSYRLGLISIPAPPRTGENTLLLVVRDRRGNPVKNAKLEARFVMEAMGAMPRMESRGRIKEAGGGAYRVRYG